MIRFFATISFLACFAAAIAQDKKSVVIGSLIDRPNALLVISPPAGNQGFLLPQLSSAQRLSIAPASPADDGLMVFDLTDKSFYYWNNGAWVKGLGEAGSQTMTYDPVTQRLTLSGGGLADLSTLKEVPSQTAQAGKYLTTNGTTLSWATVASIGDISGIITANGSGLTGGTATGDANLAINTDGSTVSISGANQLQVTDGGISTTKLSNNSVTSAKVVDGTIANADLANNAVTSANIQDGTIVTADIASGGTSQVLTTNSFGVVSWEPKSAFGADDQTLTFTGNALTIADGNTVNLSANGQVMGPLDNLIIKPGPSDAVLTTNNAATGTQWVAQGGDVTGALDNNTVTRIQNRAVTTAVPALGDALVWNGSAWTPTSVAGGSPTTQFYSLDPSSFQGVQPDGDKDASLGLMEANNGLYAFSMLDSRTIIAPLNLPHGATIQNITVFYEITNVIGVFTPINVRLIQKSLSGGLNIDVGTVVIAPLLSIGVTSQAGSLTHTVDNSTSSYRLLIKFSHVIDADEASEATQRIYGVRVQYLK